MTCPAPVAKYFALPAATLNAAAGSDVLVDISGSAVMLGGPGSESISGLRMYFNPGEKFGFSLENRGDALKFCTPFPKFYISWPAGLSLSNDHWLIVSDDIDISQQTLFAGQSPILLGDSSILAAVDPASVLFSDDFMGALVNNWSTVTGATAGGIVPVGAALPNTGNIQLQTLTAASQGIGLMLNNNSWNQGTGFEINQFSNWLESPGWKMTWVFKFRHLRNIAAIDTTKQRFYCGLFQPNTNANTGWSRGQCFVGLRYDTDPTAPAISDTTLKFESLTRTGTGNVQGAVIDTGLAPDDRSHRVEFTSRKAGLVEFRLDGVFYGSIQTATVTISNCGFSRSGGCIEIGPPGVGAPQEWFVKGQAFSAFAGTGALAGGYAGKIEYQVNPGLTSWAIGFLNAGANVAGYSPTPGTLTFTPATIPGIFFANDTQATPGSKTLDIDYFSLIWNPGLIVPPPKLNPSLSRYYIS